MLIDERIHVQVSGVTARWIGKVRPVKRPFKIVHIPSHPGPLLRSHLPAFRLDKKEMNSTGRAERRAVARAPIIAVISLDNVTAGNFRLSIVAWSQLRDIDPFFGALDLLLKHVHACIIAAAQFSSGTPDEDF